jgi:hypothetical protein
MILKENKMTKFHFKPHIIDQDLPKGYYAQTALADLDSELTAIHDVVAADLDGDGKAEIITMSDQNNLRWYKIPAWMPILVGMRRKSVTSPLAVCQE